MVAKMGQKLPKLIIFDWDGTLLDSANHIISCVRTATEKLHLPMPAEERVRSMIGLSSEVVIQRLFPELGMARQTEVFSEFRRAYFATDESQVSVYPNVIRVLEHFVSKAVTLAIATGKGRYGLEHDLEKTNLRKYFAATRCGDETFSKPHPAMVLELLDELVMPAHEAVVVGDSSYDILMAKNAKVRSIAAAYGTHTLDELAQCDPDYTIHSIDEMTLLFEVEHTK